MQHYWIDPNVSLMHSTHTHTAQYTGWLKLKYPTEQNSISRQPCEIFAPEFLGLYGRDPATILNFFKIILVFSKVMAV